MTVASPQRTAIETEQLTKRFDTGNESVTAVNELDLAIESGEVFGFLGPNGAGKSTTINMLLGFTEPTGGSVSILGHDANEESQAIRRQIGVLPEGLGLYDRLTGRRHLEFAIQWKDADDDPAALLERVGLDMADASRPVGGYSKGMKQRLALAMALVNDPSVLILDEPSSGLDPHGIKRLREIVTAESRNGTTVFFSSHIMGQVEAVCDRVGILYEGELVAVDSISGLRKTIGSGTELQLHVGEDVSQTVAHLDPVLDVQYNSGILRVETADPSAKAAVVSHLHNTGVQILDVDSTEASLEDVFTAYTTDNGQVDTAVERTERTKEVVLR